MRGSVTHKTGETAYIAAGAHAEKNISDQPLEEVMIEFKPGAMPCGIPRRI